MHHSSLSWNEKILVTLRIKTIFIHMSGCRIFLSKNEKIVIYLILIIMVLLCQSRFPHLAKVSTPCFYASQGFHTFPRFLHLVSIWVKVSTPCQGSHTLFLCELRFPHLAKVLTPCFYVNQGSHTLPRFLHLVSIWVKVSTPCFYVSIGFHPLQRFLLLFLYKSRFPHLAKVPTPYQGSHTFFLCKSRFPHLAKVPTPCRCVSQGFYTLPRFPHLVATLVKVYTPCF